MSEEPYVSRREFDTLARQVERIDEHGSRGVGILQQQITDLIKDVLEIKADTSRQLREHEQAHERERRERTSSRRWAAGTAVGLLAALAGLYPLIILAVHP